MHKTLRPYKVLLHRVLRISTLGFEVVRCFLYVIELGALFSLGVSVLALWVLGFGVCRVYIGFLTLFSLLSAISFGL